MDLGFKHYRVVSINQNLFDKIEFNEAESSLFTTDLVKPFSSEKLGVEGNATGLDTILWTYLVKDGYKFDVELKWINISDIKIPYVNQQRLYILTNTDTWKSEHTKELVNLIGTNQIAVQTIVVYGHSFTLESQVELQVALKQLDNKINLDIRY